MAQSATSAPRSRLASRRSRRSDDETPCATRCGRGPRRRSPPREQRTHPTRRCSVRLRRGRAPPARCDCGTLALSSARTSTACVGRASGRAATQTRDSDQRRARCPSSIASARRALDRDERADEAELARADLRRQSPRLGRQESPVAQFGARVAGGGHLVEHLPRGSAAGRRLELEHAPRAWGIGDADHRKSRSRRRAASYARARPAPLAASTPRRPARPTTSRSRRPALRDRQAPRSRMAAARSGASTSASRSAASVSRATDARAERGRIGREVDRKRIAIELAVAALRYRYACRSRRCLPLPRGRRCSRNRGCRAGRW